MNDTPKPSSSRFGTLIFIYFGWVIVTYILGELLLYMYSTGHTNKPLLWVILIVMIPAAIYATWETYDEDKTISIKHIFTAICYCGMLVYSGYFSLLKVDAIASALTKPKTEQQLIIKSLEKYRVRHTWDHTNVNVLYQGHDVQLEASKTAFFLLQNKKAISVTIGQTYGGNYFVTDVYLPSQQRWDARRAMVRYEIDLWQWIVILIVLVVGALWIKRKYYPHVSIKDWSLKKKILVGLGAFAIIYVLVCAAIIIAVKVQGS